MFNLFILFIFGCAGSLLQCTALCSCSRAFSSCGDFSCCGAWALGRSGFRSRGTRAQLPWGMWNMGSQTRDLNLCSVHEDVPGGSEGKVSACNAGDPGSIPGSGRSPGEGDGNPLAWTIPWMEEPHSHGVTKSQTQLSDFTSLHWQANS